MIKYLIIFFFSSFAVFGQQSPEVRVIKVKKEDPAIYTTVDKTAEFPGGETAMRKFIADRLPNDSIKDICNANFNGVVSLSFVVETDGTVSDIQVLKTIEECTGCDTKAINTVKKMPKWKPAILKNQSVRSKVTLPIHFECKGS